MMMKNFKRIKSLIFEAKKAISSCDKKLLNTVLDEIYICLSKEEKLCSTLMPEIMDLGKTNFSYYNYFIRYKPFDFSPSYIYIKKAMLSDNFNDFVSFLKKFISSPGKKDSYMLFFSNFVVGDYKESFFYLKEYISKCQDIIIDDICFPLRRIDNKFQLHVSKFSLSKMPEDDYGKMYKLYLRIKSGRASIREILLFDPPNSIPWMNYFKGILLMDIMHYKEAATCFKKVIKAYPQMLEPRGYLSEISFIESEKSPDHKLLLYDYKLENLRRSSLSWFASLKLFSGDADGAMKFLRDKRDPLSFCWLGASLALKWHYREALFFLDKAISYEKEDIEALIWKAHCLFFLGEKEKAIFILRKLLKEESQIWPLAYLCAFGGRIYIERFKIELCKFAFLLKKIKPNEGYLLMRNIRGKDIRNMCLKMISLPYGLRREENIWLYFMLKKAGFLKK